jgi:hypothetical protein
MKFCNALFKLIKSEYIRPSCLVQVNQIYLVTIYKMKIVFFNIIHPRLSFEFEKRFFNEKVYTHCFFLHYRHKPMRRSIIRVYSLAIFMIFC